MYTGNTLVGVNGEVKGSVYPCVYREHNTADAVYTSLNGLSLCIQGTLVFPIRTPLPARFIPVYTGNTEIIFKLPVQHTVYPCVYREHYMAK